MRKNKTVGKMAKKEKINKNNAGTDNALPENSMVEISTYPVAPELILQEDVLQQGDNEQQLEAKFQLSKKEAKAEKKKRAKQEKVAAVEIEEQAAADKAISEEQTKTEEAVSEPKVSVSELDDMITLDTKKMAITTAKVRKEAKKLEEFHDISETLLCQHQLIAATLKSGDLRGNISKLEVIEPKKIQQPTFETLKEGDLVGNITKLAPKRHVLSDINPKFSLGNGRYINGTNPLARNKFVPAKLAKAEFSKVEKTPDGSEKSVKGKVKVKEVPIERAVRYNTNLKKGLTFEQVEKRVEDGLSNVVNTKKGKSYAQIIVGNIFTFFNFIYIAVAATLLSFGIWQDVMFLGVAAINTFIAIFQEVKSKMTLDRLKLLTAPHASVVRNGLNLEIAVNEIVLDDIMLLNSGRQVSADSKIVDGILEVNEAMLTGESVPVVKTIGESVFAGSFITGGNGIVRVDRIGKYNYIEGLTMQARKYHKPRSEMLRSLKLVLHIVAFIVPVLAIFSYLNNLAIIEAIGKNPNPIIEAVRKTAGTIIGIIPAGPFLLTSFALALSVWRLSKNNTMVQELYCIEMLARVDVLCLDKTGTITDGTMKVVECVDIKNDSSFMLKEIISSMLDALDDNNMTSIALKDYFGVSKTLKKTGIIPFSSTRKFSAVSFEDNGTYFIGASEFVLTTPNAKLEALVKKYSNQGLRVLLLAHSSGQIGEDAGKIPNARKPIAIIAIEDHIRPDAPKTIKWFKDNGVAVKIISGDNPLTVSEIARKVGVVNADKFVSLEGLSDKEIIAVANNYTVFGRVTPEQKAVLVKAMKSWGRTVAMTGDGVNDILALKESDCAIAMASGSEAARNVSHLILLDNNFASLPKVVGEGRRVVNNIQNATSLYFMKTVYTLIISILAILLHRAYPYTTSQVIMLEIFIVGVPTTFLAMQKNNNIIKGNFLANVFKRALPASITFLIGTVLLYLADMYFIEIDQKILETMAVLTLTYAALFALYFACKPYNVFRGILFAGAAITVTVVAIALSGIGLVQGEPIFESLSFNEFVLMFAIIELSFPLMLLALKAFNAFKIES